MFVFKTPLLQVISVAIICCTIVRWLVNDLAHDHTPRFTAFLNMPIISALRRRDYREACLEASTIIGVLWIGKLNVPWAFHVSLILLLFCLISVAIDLSHMVVPDKLTIPGVLAGIGFSMVYPAWQRCDSVMSAGRESLMGMLIGAGVIVAVIEIGKIAFGKDVRDIDPPAKFTFQYAQDGNHSLVANGEALKWEDLFNRKTDELLVTCKELSVGFPVQSGTTLKLCQSAIQIDNGEEEEIDAHTEFSGVATKLVVPREAMGYGDAQFMAVVGAFAGVSGTLVVLFCGVMIGAFLGILTKASGRGNQIPFVPALGLGVLCWAINGDGIKYLIIHH